jgi:hypothetical protein
MFHDPTSRVVSRNILLFSPLDTGRFEDTITTINKSNVEIFLDRMMNHL